MHFIGSFLLIFWLGFWGNHSITTDKDTKVQTELKKIMEELHAIGLSVVVVDKGQIVYNESLGYKSIDTSNGNGKEPLRNGYIFRIASISKTFVATAIFQLIEKGQLALNDDINRYLNFKVSNPKYPEIPITVKMLLSHRSSINDSQGYHSFDHISPRKGKNYQSCYNDYAPGEGYQYCNYNYNLLGAIIEKISGERFDVYIEKYVTGPLNLNCSFNVEQLDSNLLVPLYKYNASTKRFNLMPEAYKSYKDYLNNYRLASYTPLLSPTGGMKISAEDLAKYMIMHIQRGRDNNSRIITKKSEKLIRQVVTPESGYALSFREYKGLISGEILCGQTGGAYGLFSAMIFQPEKKYGFVVITNGCISESADGYQDLHKRVINCLYDNFIRKN
nr:MULTISPECIES: serine hydrolase domain-containing protein [unclassified Butyricimonas]